MFSVLADYEELCSDFKIKVSDSTKQYIVSYRAKKKFLNYINKLSIKKRFISIVYKYLYKRYRFNVIHNKYIKYGSYNDNTDFTEFNINSTNKIIKEIFNTEDISLIKKNLDKNNYNYGFTDGTIYNVKDKKKTGKQYVDKKVRNSTKKIIRKNKSPKLYNKIISILEKSNIFCTDHEYSNNIDVLYYPKNGFFLPHRDDIKTGEVSIYSNNNYHIYTVVICLSECDNLNSLEGATVIYSNYHKLQIWDINIKRSMNRHSFKTGSIKGKSVIFNSNLLHSVIKTESSIIKLKFEIYSKSKINTELIYPCKCCNCNLKSKENYDIIIKKTFYCNQMTRFNIPIEIIEEISKYLGKGIIKCNCYNKVERIPNIVNYHSYDSRIKFLKNGCSCGCIYCETRCKIIEYNSDSDHYDSDKRCNGDDY